MMPFQRPGRGQDALHDAALATMVDGLHRLVADDLPDAREMFAKAAQGCREARSRARDANNGAAVARAKRLITVVSALDAVAAELEGVEAGRSSDPADPGANVSGVRP